MTGIIGTPEVSSQASKSGPKAFTYQDQIISGVSSKVSNSKLDTYSHSDSLRHGQLHEIEEEQADLHDMHINRESDTITTRS